MIESAFNPHVSIVAPFPALEVFDLFCWQQAARDAICDDSVPSTSPEWMEDHERAMLGNVQTLGIQKDEMTGGYFEAHRFPAYDNFNDTEFMVTARCRAIFKRDFFGWHVSRPAINLCLQALFADGIETAFFPIFAHNAQFKNLLYACGCQEIGLIEPGLQEGRERERLLLAVTSREWTKRNRKFLEAQAAHVGKSEPVAVGI